MFVSMQSKFERVDRFKPHIIYPNDICKYNEVGTRSSLIVHLLHFVNHRFIIRELSLRFFKSFSEHFRFHGNLCPDFTYEITRFHISLTHINPAIQFRNPINDHSNHKSTRATSTSSSAISNSNYVSKPSYSTSSGAPPPLHFYFTDC